MAKANMRNSFWTMDVMDFLTKKIATDFVDLTIFSPPYEAARHYQSTDSVYEKVTILRGSDWVDWMTSVVMECIRVTHGPVLLVVNSRTKNFSWSPTPCLLVSSLHALGVTMRKPLIFQKSGGIPGSGGPDWLRDDYEFILACTKGGRLPWSDNTACGNPPKYPHRFNVPSGGRKAGDSLRSGTFVDKPPPKVCNPGNLLFAAVGKGHMGNLLAHENEAPFPEALIEQMILPFCPPDGIVLDPMGGSGTVAATARRLGRAFVYNDSRESQARLAIRRVYDLTPDDPLDEYPFYPALEDEL